MKARAFRAHLEKRLARGEAAVAAEIAGRIVNGTGRDLQQIGVGNLADAWSEQVAGSTDFVSGRGKMAVALGTGPR